MSEFRGQKVWPQVSHPAIVDGVCTCKGHKCGHCGNHGLTIVHTKVVDAKEHMGYFIRTSCVACEKKKGGTRCKCPYGKYEARRFGLGEGDSYCERRDKHRIGTRCPCRLSYCGKCDQFGRTIVHSKVDDPEAKLGFSVYSWCRECTEEIGGKIYDWPH